MAFMSRNDWDSLDPTERAAMVRRTLHENHDERPDPDCSLCEADTNERAAYYRGKYGPGWAGVPTCEADWDFIRDEARGK